VYEREEEKQMPTKFEDIGVRMQHESLTPELAVKMFTYSCEVCASRGKQIKCDMCSIKAAHEHKIEAFKVAEKKLSSLDMRDIKFQEVGIKFQHQAYNVESAKRSFNVSCRNCKEKNMGLSCETCLIKKVHEQITVVFQQREDERHERFVEKRSKMKASNMNICKDL
jgi:hypothetical protein